MGGGGYCENSSGFHGPVYREFNLSGCRVWHRCIADHYDRYTDETVLVCIGLLRRQAECRYVVGLQETVFAFVEMDELRQVLVFGPYHHIVYGPRCCPTPLKSDAQKRKGRRLLPIVPPMQ